MLAGNNSFVAANTTAEAYVDQNKYIFWMNDENRVTARSTAENMAAQLDAPSNTWLSTAKTLYSRSSRSLQERFSATEFEGRVSQHRGVAGNIVERSFQGVEGGFLTLPNLETGKYCIVIFDLLTGPKRNLILTEQFTLALSIESSWKLAGYYAGMKPFYRD